MDAQVELRPVGEDDLDLLYRLTNDPLAAGEYEWFGWQDPGPLRLRWAQDRLLGADGGTLMVIAGAVPVGFVDWRRNQGSRTSHCWAIGIAIAPQARGRGYGTQAQRLVVRYLFAHTQVNRIEACTGTENVAEQRALEKAGFTREGVLRGLGWMGGRWHDGVLYSVLRGEVDLGEDSAAWYTAPVPP